MKKTLLIVLLRRWLGKANSYTYYHILHPQTTTIFNLGREKMNPNQTPKLPTCKHANNIHAHTPPVLSKPLSPRLHPRPRRSRSRSRSSRRRRGIRRPPLSSPLISPDLLDAPPIRPRAVPVALRPLVPLPRQTLVHVALDVVAVPEGFVQEAPRVALVEGGHDLFAVWRGG